MSEHEGGAPVVEATGNAKIYSVESIQYDESIAKGNLGALTISVASGTATRPGKRTVQCSRISLVSARELIDEINAPVELAWISHILWRDNTRRKPATPEMMTCVFIDADFHDVTGVHATPPDDMRERVSAILSQSGLSGWGHTPRGLRALILLGEPLPIADWDRDGWPVVAGAGALIDDILRTGGVYGGRNGYSADQATTDPGRWYWAPRTTTDDDPQHRRWPMEYLSEEAISAADLASLAPEPSRRSHTRRSRSTRSRRDVTSLASALDRHRTWLAALTDEEVIGHGGDGSSVAIRCAARARSMGVAVDDHVAAMLPVSERRVALGQEAVGEDLIRRTYDESNARIETRPEIVIDPHDLGGNIDALENLLAPTGRVVVHGDHLAVLHVATVDEIDAQSSITTPAGMPTLRLLDRDRLTVEADRVARCVTITAKGVRRCAVPRDVTAGLLSRGEWRLPAVDAIVTEPVLRPDGTVLSAPGIDSLSRVLYAPHGRQPEIPSRPTCDDALAACCILLDPIREYAWADPPVDRAVTLSAILSIVARPAIDGPVPVHLLDASTRGSGKDLLASVISIIATGMEAPSATYPTEEEERRKTITAIALRGHRIHVWGNVDVPIGGGAMEHAATSLIWSQRILGRSELVPDLPMRTVWLTTGNNQRVRGDYARRVLRCRQDPQCELPEERTFSVADLRKHVRERRVELLGAALTILRAYHLEDRPHPGGALLGSFEAWDGLVRGAILWLAREPSLVLGDPRASQAGVRSESDDDRQIVGQLYGAWRLVIGSEPVTARALMDRLRCIPSESEHTREARRDLNEALEAVTDGTVRTQDGRPTPPAVGTALARFRDRIVDGYVLRSFGGGGHACRWRIEPADRAHLRAVDGGDS